MACPRCNSPKIFSKKFGFGDVTMHEYSCENCGLFEEKKSTDADFSAWRRRWESEVAGSRDVQAIAAAATARAVAAAKASGDDEGGDEHEVGGPVPDLKPVIAAPDDDRPRLAYARAMEKIRPERAEFIRLQIERSSAERRSGATLEKPGPREIELRAKYGKEWASAVAAYGRSHTTSGKFRGYEYERGFVALLRTDPDIVIDPKSRLFEIAPIQHIDVTADGPWRDVMVSPVVSRLRSLGLPRLGMTNDDAKRLAEEGHLERIEWLDLRGNKIGTPGVEALLASPVIRKIPVVLLAGNPVDPAKQFKRDYDGTVMDFYLPPSGKAAEEKYGRINWLHLPAEGAPDPFLARNAKYDD